MGGQLFLNNGKAPDRSNVCVSGYQSGTENYALSNFENNHGQGYSFKDPHLGQIRFPTSEHYLHFQKLTPEAKKENYKTWSMEHDPGTILRGIRDPANKTFYIKDENYAYRTPNGNFDIQRWDAEKIAVQMQINATKFQQSQDFRNSINKSIELGRALNDGKGPATIIEDTSSLGRGSKPEEEWGTGPGGTGKNILGNSQTAFATLMQNLKVDNKPPELSTYQSSAMKTLYDNAENQYKNTLQPTLIDIRKKSGKNVGLNQPDTSNLSGDLVQRVNLSQGEIKNTPHAHSSSQQPKPRAASPLSTSLQRDRPNNSVSPNSSSHQEINSWQPSRSQQMASQETCLMIKQMMKVNAMRQLSPEIPIVCKGAQNGTLKIAFDNPQDAQAFRNLLNDSGFKTTYYGGNDKYPMEHAGKKLDHIVRFENNGDKTCIPEEALEFLKDKFKNDHEKIANIVEGMGFEKPELEQTLSLR